MNVVPKSRDTSGCSASLPDSGAVFELPVAPQVTARTRFSSALPRRLPFLLPAEAMRVLETELARRPHLEMVGISGPGDPLAVPDTLFSVLGSVRRRSPRLRLGLRTLGFGSARFAAQLAKAGVDYVELVCNGVKAEILEKLYAWIRPGLKTLPLADAVQLLIREQKNGVAALRYQGISVQVVTMLYPGCNVDHVRSIAERMREYGANALSLLPFAPEPGAEVVLPPLSEGELSQTIRVAGDVLPLRKPLLLGIDPVCRAEDRDKTNLPRPDQARPHVAVTSSDGVEVDLHLGAAEQVLVYGPREDGLVCLLEVRPAPKAGSGQQRWQELATALHDCCALLTLRAGEAPQSLLADRGIRIVQTSGQIAPLIDTLYGGGKGKKK